MVYGELGRYPLRVLIYSRLIKFWAKIITPSNMNKISFILYQIQLNQLNNGKKKCKWLGFVKSTLEKLGLNEVWQSQQFPNASWLYLSIKRKLQDQFIQKWMHDISNTNSYFWKYPNKQKLVILLNSKDKKLICKICNFVRKVLKKFEHD